VPSVADSDASAPSPEPVADAGAGDTQPEAALDTVEQAS